MELRFNVYVHNNNSKTERVSSVLSGENIKKYSHKHRHENSSVTWMKSVFLYYYKRVKGKFIKEWKNIKGKITSVSVWSLPHSSIQINPT